MEFILCVLAIVAIICFLWMWWPIFIKKVKISDLYDKRDVAIRNKKFEGYTIEGPAVIAPRDGCHIEHCSWEFLVDDAGRDDFIILIQEDTYPVGIICVYDTDFIKCRFKNVRIALTEKYYNLMKTAGGFSC